MADGSTKAIDQVRVGDTIANSVPGVAGTEAHEVTAVIVTHTDHDFVDLTIKATAESGAKKGVKSGAKSLGKKVARKAAFGLAASAAVLGALGASHGHGTVQEPATKTVAAVSSATPGQSAKAAEGGTSGAQGAHLTTTFHHPFYDETRSAFVEGKDLKVGDVLQTPTGTAEVTGVRLYHANTTTYDLTIGSLHTYYVQAGDTPVLVHNCNGAIAGHSTKCQCANGAKPRIPRNPYGMRGKPSTVQHLDEVRDELMDANPGWKHVAGGTDRNTGEVKPEQTIFGPNGEPRRPDLSFELEDGSPLYVNTVDTLSDGVTPDSRELANAIDIHQWGAGPVLMIPKP
jgi:hypothetical protein